MRLAWPEKFVLVIFGLITLVLLFLGGGFGEYPDPSEYCQQLRHSYPTWTSANSYCFTTAEQHWRAFAGIEWILFLKLVLPIWIVLRLIDLFGGGIAIRREYREELKSQAARKRPRGHRSGARRLAF